MGLQTCYGERPHLLWAGEGTKRRKTTPKCTHYCEVLTVCTLLKNVAAACITQTGALRDGYPRSRKWFRKMSDVPETSSANMSTQSTILNTAVPCLRQLPASTLGGMGSIPCQCMWDMWWANRQWDTFSPRVLLPCQICHRCPKLIHLTQTLHKTGY